MELIIGILCVTAVALTKLWLNYLSTNLDREYYYKYGSEVPVEDPDDWWKNQRN